MKEKSIEKQILIWLIGLTIVPLVILILQGHHCSTQAILGTKSNQLLSILEWKKDSLEKQIQDVKNDLSLISIMSVNENAKTPMCHTYGCSCSPLLHLYELKNCYKGIGLYDLKGKLIEKSGNNLKKQLPKDIISRIAKGERFISQQKDFKSMVIYTTSQNKLTNKIIGYIAAEIDLEGIFKNLLKSSPNFGESGEVFLLSLKGKTIRYSKEKDKLIISDNKGLLNIISRKKPGVIFEATLFGKKKLLGFQKVKGLNLDIVISVNKNETLKWVHILLKRSILTSLLVFVIVIFVAIKIAKKISMPLKDLEGVSNEIISGNINARIKNYDTKEAKAVADAFNTMIDRLTEQSKELAQKSSLAAIGELSSSIVHEMRNPLSSVKLNINAVAEKLKDDKTYSELLNITKSQVSRLENMLSELLNFGKPIELKKASIKPVELVEQALEIVSPEISKLGQKAFVISELKENTLIYGDKEHLLRALSNIIKNAAESNPKNGKITVYLKEKNNKVFISVEDQGKGLSKAVKDMIFKPFFTTKEKGTGLGLAIVKKIIEYHNGEIKAENGKNGGAIFTIVLETKKPEEKNG